MGMIEIFSGELRYLFCYQTVFSPLQLETDKQPCGYFYPVKLFMLLSILEPSVYLLRGNNSSNYNIMEYEVLYTHLEIAVC